MLAFIVRAREHSLYYNDLLGKCPLLLRTRPDRMKKLPKDELATYKLKLQALKARLRGDVDTMAEAALNKNRMDASGDLSAMPIHMADVGTDNFEQEFTLSLMQSESETIKQVEGALLRIADGTYGICEECETKIPKARLNAIPYASKCVKCASAESENRW